MKLTHIVRQIYYLWYYFIAMKRISVLSVTLVEAAEHAQGMCAQFLRYIPVTPLPTSPPFYPLCAVPVSCIFDTDGFCQECNSHA
jgi:hypothetical protein